MSINQKPLEKYLAIEPARKDDEYQNQKSI